MVMMIMNVHTYFSEGAEGITKSYERFFLDLYYSYSTLYILGLVVLVLSYIRDFWAEVRAEFQACLKRREEMLRQRALSGYELRQKRRREREEMDTKHAEGRRNLSKKWVRDLRGNMRREREEEKSGHERDNFSILAGWLRKKMDLLQEALERNRYYRTDADAEQY